MFRLLDTNQIDGLRLMCFFPESYCLFVADQTNIKSYSFDSHPPPHPSCSCRLWNSGILYTNIFCYQFWGKKTKLNLRIFCRYILHQLQCCWQQLCLFSCLGFIYPLPFFLVLRKYCSLIRCSGSNYIICNVLQAYHEIIIFCRVVSVSVYLHSIGKIQR